MQQKIIFFDLDNTLYSHQTNSFPQSAIKGVRDAQKAGCLTVLTTGRNIALIKDLKTFAYFNFDYIISANGTLITDKAGNTIYEDPVSDDIVGKMIAIANKYHHNLCFLSKEAYFLLNKRSKNVHKGYDPIHITPPSKKKLNKEKIYQINLFCEDDEVMKYASLFQYLTFTKLPFFGFDVYKKGNNKASAIKKLLSFLQINIDDTYAFGDGFNDSEMLQYCRHAIAMGNSIEAVKAVSTFTTSDIDADGIYKGLKYYGLI